MSALVQIAASLVAVLSFLTGGTAGASTPPHALFGVQLAQASSTATVIFAGDMMFDRSVRTAIDTRGGDFVFSCIDRTLSQADVVVANLEGPITNNQSQSVGSVIGAPDNYVFTFPLSTAKLLYAHHVRIVNVGNNHILNFGTAGLLSTEAALARAGVAYFGQAAGASSVYRTAIHGVPLAFINYNEFGPSSPLGVHGNASTTIAQVLKARADGFLPIVYTHWGIEYEPTAAQYVRRLAHRFIDAGAVAVIGSHPHVVENNETYTGAPIYYSLGNFIFDQYWTDAVDHGLMIAATFASSTLQSVRQIPIVMNKDGSTCVAAQ